MKKIINTWIFGGLIIFHLNIFFSNPPAPAEIPFI